MAEFRLCVQTFRGLVEGVGVTSGLSLSGFLLASCAPGTLLRYKSALGRCAAFLEGCEGEFEAVVQSYLVSVLASGGSGAQVRALLSGLALVAKLRLFAWVCPELWWRLPKVGVKSGYAPRYKGTPRLEWFKGLLKVCTSPSD